MALKFGRERIDSLPLSCQMIDTAKLQLLLATTKQQLKDGT